MVVVSLKRADLSSTASVVRQGTQDFAVFKHLRVRMTTPGRPTQEALLALEPLEVGSSPECQLSTVDPLISRRHCLLSRMDAGILLEDLGSKNGSFINGVRVERGWVQPGQTITVGDSRLELVTEKEATQLKLHSSNRFGGAVGMSLLMRQLFAELERAAHSASALLIWGETGTGKELVAHAVHEAGPRSEKPFVVFDCGATPPALLEAELFGHEKGAFSGAEEAREGLVERADGGTLFLDELGELPLSAQTSLLRLLENRTFRRVGGNELRRADIRFIAATHRDLRGRVAAKAFREDLYFRIAVLQVSIPALRNRLEDLPLLVEEFLGRRDPPMRLSDLPPGLFAMLRNHAWPGNVRELKNVLDRLVTFPDAPVAELLDASRGSDAAGWSRFARLPLRQARDAAVEHFEREYFRERLREHDHKVSAAANAMKVSRQFLYRMLAKYGLRADE